MYQVILYCQLFSRPKLDIFQHVESARSSASYLDFVRGPNSEYYANIVV
jgi:hypothetical protein